MTSPLFDPAKETLRGGMNMTSHWWGLSQWGAALRLDMLYGHQQVSTLTPKEPLTVLITLLWHPAQLLRVHPALQDTRHPPLPWWSFPFLTRGQFWHMAVSLSAQLKYYTLGLSFIRFSSSFSKICTKIATASSLFQSRVCRFLSQTTVAYGTVQSF